jgi:uncharacterized protein (DUF2342 family)
MTRRVATTIEPAVDRRLRLLAAIEGRPLGHVLSDQLDKVLPSDDELADRLRGEAIPA